jgi:deoxyribodipyrimidine photo-lyase
MHRVMRLSDNATLWHAAREAEEVIPVLVLNTSPAYEEDSPRRLFLRGTIRALHESLLSINSSLAIVPGNVLNDLPQWVRRHRIEAVYAPEAYDPIAMARDESLARALAAIGCPMHFFRDSHLFGKGDILTQQGEPFRVFTPFSRRALGKIEEAAAPFPRVTRVRTPRLSESLTIDRFPAFQRHDGDAGERSGMRRLRRFVGSSLDAYARQRDFPAINGTSRLSPHLSAGSIGIRSVLENVREGSTLGRGRPVGHGLFLKELLWREFYGHVLMHYPFVVQRSFNEKFDDLAWRENRRQWKRWCAGQTGYPIVDAGMRQLLQEGWMHNRVRMVVASFLTKDLHMNWQVGERFFFQHLVDADIASNNGGWQWVAGSGTDAAPYFRIFNPSRQSERFDPDGTYIRKYVPELSRIPPAFIHEPWKLSPEEQREAGCVIGKQYPAPMVDHAIEREVALALLKQRPVRRSLAGAS